MRKLSLVLAAALALVACARAPAKPADAPAPTAAPALPPGLSAEDLTRLQRAQALREEGLELLYAKDPRVKNPKKAYEKLLESAKLGDPVAMDSVGGFHTSGLAGVEKSCPIALEWFEKSAAAGYPLAANNLAYLLVTCREKSRRDAAKAEQILRVIFQGNPSLIALLDTYAALLAEQGNFKLAASTMELVVDLEELTDTNPERIDEAKNTLRLYRKKKKLDATLEAEPHVFRPTK